MQLFGQFTKTERRADGTLIVSGICSAPSVDRDGETILASAMRAAIPDYFRTGPAVREQHDSTRAVGTGIAMEVDSEGRTHFECLVVDPVTIRKITSKPPVLRGFSVGGTVPPNGRDPRDSSVITSLRLSEVSLVDRPSQPEAVVTMWKADGATPDKAAWLATSRQTPIRGDALPRRLPAIPPERYAPPPSAVIAKVQGERDQALAKLERLQGERDSLRKALRVAGARATAAEVERDAANVELARRPKGAVRDVSAYKVVEKGEDTAAIIGATEPKKPDPLDAIRKAQRRPLRGWGDR